MRPCCSQTKALLPRTALQPILSFGEVLKARAAEAKGGWRLANLSAGKAGVGMSPHRIGEEKNFLPKIDPKPEIPKKIHPNLIPEILKWSPRLWMKYFQNYNSNAVAVVAAVLETTCRTHLLWSLPPLMLNHRLCRNIYVC